MQGRVEMALGVYGALVVLRHGLAFRNVSHSSIWEFLHALVLFFLHQLVDKET